MTIRLDKYPANPERDEKHAASIAEFAKLYQERSDKLRKAGTAEPALEDFRWQVEELRVSLFAQELRTPFPVSVKRLKKSGKRPCASASASGGEPHRAVPPAYFAAASSFNVNR